MQAVIQEEVEDLVKHFTVFDKQDFKYVFVPLYLCILFIFIRMETVFGVPVINILWSIVAGNRFQMDDPKVQRMMSLLNR